MRLTRPWQPGPSGCSRSRRRGSDGSPRRVLLYRGVVARHTLIVSLKQQRYKANLRERYRDDVAALRQRVRQQLDVARVDALGEALAGYASHYRQQHGIGASRHEACAHLGIPDGLPRQYHNTWRGAAASEVFLAARARGWINFDGRRRSLDAGPRHLAQAA
jgi:hypothetical protein